MFARCRITLSRHSKRASVPQRSEQAPVRKSHSEVAVSAHNNWETSEIPAFSGGGFLPSGTTEPYSCGKGLRFNLPNYAINPYIGRLEYAPAHECGRWDHLPLGMGCWS